MTRWERKCAIFRRLIEFAMFTWLSEGVMSYDFVSSWHLDDSLRAKVCDVLPTHRVVCGPVSSLAQYSAQYFTHWHGDISMTYGVVCGPISSECIWLNTRLSISPTEFVIFPWRIQFVIFRWRMELFAGLSLLSVFGSILGSVFHPLSSWYFHDAFSSWYFDDAMSCVWASLFPEYLVQ